MSDENNSAQTLVQVGRIVGQIEGVQTRLNGQDQRIADVRNDIAQRFTEHESRENPVLKQLDVRLAKIERLVYIAIGAVMVLSGVIAFGLRAIEQGFRIK
jgi:hypothetical protein